MSEAGDYDAVEEVKLFAKGGANSKRDRGTAAPPPPWSQKKGGRCPE